MAKNNERGSNLEIGADIMAVTLFIFIIMTIVMEPVDENSDASKKQTEMKSLQDMELAESESGTGDLSEENRIDVFIFGDRIEITGDSRTIRLSTMNEFTQYMRNLPSGQKSLFTIYAHRDISFQNVVNAIDVIKINNPQATINIGVTTK